MKNALQILGVASLFAWTAIGGFAWFKVKSHVQVTIQEQGTEADEGLALLSDRLDVLGGDFDALVGSLEQNFALLANAMQAGTAGEAVENVRLAERLGHLEAALPEALSARETAVALSSVLSRLEHLSQNTERLPLALVGSDPAALASAPEPESVPLEATNASVSAAPLVAEAPPAVVPQPVVAAELSEAAEPAPKQSFLAFRLPSRDFIFEGLQTFEVLQDLSRVGFDGKSTLHDFTGVSNRVSGSFEVDLAHAEQGISGGIEIASASLDTGLAGRDEAMAEHLGTEEFESIRFEPTAFEPVEVDADGQRLVGNLRGRMVLHGVSRGVSLAIDAHVDESRRLVIEGELPLLLSDYEVEAPNKLGVIAMDDEVRVWLHLRARAQPSEVAH